MLTNLKTVIKKYWGYDGFLALQKEAMECALSGRDSLVVLPTGGGKSLCFQAPALTLPGLTMVVSPLISLMKDQVDTLLECGVPAGRLDSSMSAWEQDQILTQVNNNKLKLLYLAPERIVMENFLNILKNVKVSMIAVDEAHCISMWGHDFRPEYRQLGNLKNIFPNIAIHSYTATATKQVREDIVKQLGLSNPEVIIGSFDRPNLLYKVEKRHKILDQVCPILDRHKGESGIIYCIRRSDVDSMCESLKLKGYKVLPYHAGLENGDRKNNQEAFIQERVDTIVATVAFGMGIDKSNIRYVIHAGMPKSLEHYQQETGRAGRDGLEALCHLFYSGSDYAIWKSILKDNEEESLKIALKKLSSIYDYCVAADCRHKSILNYFGQSLENESCSACDICLGDIDYLSDSLEISQKILSCIVRLKESFNKEYTALVLVGSKEEEIVENNHNQLSTYGILSEHSIDQIEDWINTLRSQGYIYLSGEKHLKVTQKGWKAIKGEATPRLTKKEIYATRKAPTEKKSKIEVDSWLGVDRDLFEVLKELRLSIARKKRVPAYAVFSDATLRDMARLKPTTADDFLLINGVGQKKSQKYSNIFIEVIKKFGFNF